MNKPNYRYHMSKGNRSALRLHLNNLKRQKKAAELAIKKEKMNNTLIKAFEKAVEENKFPELLALLNPPQDVEKFFNDTRQMILENSEEK